MEITTLIGFIGLFFSIFVAPPQLIKIVKSRKTGGVSILTYLLLCFVMICYFIHALAIKDVIFAISNGLNFIVNFTILICLFKYKK